MASPFSAASAFVLLVVVLRGRGLASVVVPLRSGLHVLLRRRGAEEIPAGCRLVNYNRSRRCGLVNDHRSGLNVCRGRCNDRCRSVCHHDVRTIQQIHDRSYDLHCCVAAVMMPVMIFGVCRCGSCHCEYCHCCQAADPFCFLCVRHNPISLIEGFCFPDRLLRSFHKQ